MIDASNCCALPTPGARGTSIYLSYELIIRSDPNKGHTEDSDVWAFGMTIYVSLPRL